MPRAYTLLKEVTKVSGFANIEIEMYFALKRKEM